MDKKSKKVSELDPNKMPRHIAIILDGNGRWAKKRLLPRQLGHRAGIQALRRTVEAVDELGIPILTVFAFSTENWKRPLDEVQYLMSLLLEFVDSELRDLHKNNVKVNLLGNITQLAPLIQEKLIKATELTINNKGLILNICINYGGRAEILQATRKIAVDVRDGKLDPEQIDEGLFNSRLYTVGISDPDLLIRTAGEMRLSNFLLWQIAYAEIWVTDVFWPDFNKSILLKAISDYQKRDRRFGALSKDDS
ncbi:MAG: isoprenyl transferase [Chitinophagales bacterium]